MKLQFAVLLMSLSMRVVAQVQDVYTIPKFTQLKIEGYLGRKLDACITNGIRATDEDYLVAPFRQRKERTQWQTEFWGKWFTSAADAYRYTGDAALMAQLKRAVDGLLDTQTPDGYIGNYAAAYRLQQWDIWGMKYCLLGLLDDYELTKDPRTLTGMKKLADYVAVAVMKAEVPVYRLGNYKGMAAASILEPMVRLYRITKEKRYLDFANYIVASWKEPASAQLITKALQGIPVGARFPVPKTWYGPDNGQKAYEMMSCYEGLLELYRVTGNKEYLDAVVAAADNIRETEIMITGSGASMECWFGGAATQSIPVKHTMEACVTVTWLKFCLQLLRTTGDVKWANEIEKSYYNALLGTMKPDGSTWSKYIGMKGKKYLGEDQCGMHTNCCIANGPRGMMLAAREAVMEGPDGIAINLYTPLKAAVLRNGNKDQRLDIKMNTGYPVSDTVTIELGPQQSAVFTIRLRIPEWSAATQIRVNGKAVNGVQAGSYAFVKREWKKGDEIQLVLDMQVRVATLKQDAQHFALLYGPLVLAADRRYQLSPFYDFYTPAYKEGKVPFAIKPGQEEALLEIRIPMTREVDGLVAKTEELVFTDFASAGNTWDDRSAYTVWLQKIRDVSKE
ncbi:glycoside hydrolase family 127 protein [Niabella sp. CC-SYL272]|uniref:beta-L-arabinofuranosidase domain-containing protein n=1 Tax=Niabella agricola TaxID=2891571 RepID=UPI001F30ADC6|nr:beta-L-arabinofuranosidase domain-containing protein [Niabella agricola]MCF3109906.1 glycoside hydrolase family 127 protein [Niabella agricola]